MIYVLVGIKNNKGTRSFTEEAQRYTEFFSVVLCVRRKKRLQGVSQRLHRVARRRHRVAQRIFSVALCITSVFLCVRRKMWIHGFARGNNKIGLFKVSEKWVHRISQSYSLHGVSQRRHRSSRSFSLWCSVLPQCVSV